MFQSKPIVKFVYMSNLNLVCPSLNTSHSCNFSTKVPLRIHKNKQKNQLKINVKRGFLSMFVNINCMHYRWKNCLVEWQDQFQNKDGKKCIIMEVIVDQSFWIWLAFLGFQMETMTLMC